MTDPKALYLDIIKRSLVNSIYREPQLVPVEPSGLLKRMIVKGLASRGLELTWRKPFDLQNREAGYDWPPPAHTMIGLKRLDNIQACVEDVLAKGVPGDIGEAGAWRGGASILMRAVLKAHGVVDRLVWVADSFKGFPPPNPERYPHDNVDDRGQLPVSIEEVKSNFESYGLLDDRVRFLEGFFCDTLPTAPIERLAIARLDGDMYESTMDGLTNWYPKLSTGGYLIVDDYQRIPKCQAAVEDYRKEHAITETIQPIDADGVYWQRLR